MVKVILKTAISMGDGRTHPRGSEMEMTDEMAERHLKLDNVELVVRGASQPLVTTRATVPAAPSDDLIGPSSAASEDDESITDDLPAEPEDEVVTPAKLPRRRRGR